MSLTGDNEEPNRTLKSVEFFSGIGGFAEACRSLPITVVQAFDQSADANLVYRHNFGVQPSARNLDSIGASQIPEADIWWLSPPCKPYTRRGNRLDDQDPRATSLKNLISLIPEKRPSAILLENVVPFQGSKMHTTLIGCLQETGYQYSQFILSPTDVGSPMKRPRLFVLAMLPQENRPLVINRDAIESLRRPEVDGTKSSLSNYLLANGNTEELVVDQQSIARYGKALNILDPSDENAVSICFTSGYAKSMKASGSLIKLPNGEIRRFSPMEISKLLGFGDAFSFPPQLDLDACFRLAGNSVDVHCVRALVSCVIANLLTAYAINQHEN